MILYPLAVLGAAQIGWQGYQFYQRQQKDAPTPTERRQVRQERMEEESAPRESRREARAARREDDATSPDASEMPRETESTREKKSDEDTPRNRRRSEKRQEELVEADTEELLGPPEKPATPAATTEQVPKGSTPQEEPSSASSSALPAPPPASAKPSVRSGAAAETEAAPKREKKGKANTRVASAGPLGPALTPGSPTVTVRPNAAHAVPAVEVARGATGRREVALTFDAGSDYRPTKKILDTLAAAGVKCTFFLTGEWAEKNPRTAKKIAEAGHEIGNHSWDHPAFTSLGTSDIQEQLDRAEEAIVATTGRSSRPYFRPPLGARDERVRKVVADDGYMTIYWTLDSWDSVRKGITAQQIRDRVLGKIQPGSIVLMHCGSQASADALPEILEGLKARNLTPVTIGGILTQ